MIPAKLSIHQLHEQLIEGGQLKRYLDRHTDNADDAAEIYQESIVRVLEQANKKTINNPLAYAISVARNLLTTPLYARELQINEQSIIGTSLEESACQHQQLVNISHIIQGMPSMRREVFELRRIQGYRRSDIAKTLGISTDAVSKHLTRAMADINSKLGGL